MDSRIQRIFLTLFATAAIAPLAFSQEEMSGDDDRLESTAVESAAASTPEQDEPQVEAFADSEAEGEEVALTRGDDNSEEDQEQVIEPELTRREINTEKIDTENFEIGVYTGVMSIEDFGSDVVSGARVAYHVTEDFFIEVAGGQTTAGTTSFERLSGSSPLLSDEERDLLYYNLSIGWNVFPGESFVGENWAFGSSMYIIGGVGNTTFAGDERFTINIGAGYRLLLTDWFAWHIDGRDHVFDIDVLGVDKATHNLEFHTGFTVYF